MGDSQIKHKLNTILFFCTEKRKLDLKHCFLEITSIIEGSSLLIRWRRLLFIYKWILRGNWLRSDYNVGFCKFGKSDVLLW